MYFGNLYFGGTSKTDYFGAYYFGELPPIVAEVSSRKPGQGAGGVQYYKHDSSWVQFHERKEIEEIVEILMRTLN